MCGIFGISTTIDPKLDYDKVISDLRQLITLSEKRGSDTFGVSFRLPEKTLVYKTNEKPTKAINKKDYKYFLKENLQKNLDKNLLLIGQTRLVTNGSKFSYKNNQPLESKNVIGIHNGIFTNLQNYDEKKTENLESYNIKSDSLTFFENISEFAKEQNFISQYIKYLKNTIGNYSVALQVRNENKIIISSNCGSLYYYFDEKFFCFASEKNILHKFLLTSKLLNSNKINKDNIIQCLNKTIIYDKDNNNLSLINHDETKNFDDKLNINTSLNLKIFNNFQYQEKKLQNLTKCTKCILPETYPHIHFDKDGVCNYCLKYEKQIFFGEDALNDYLKKFRSNSGKPDCIVGLSGGRDSCYGLHLLKTKYGLNPIAYTYDWGLTTDISRVNAAKVCGELGVEHIIRSADIEKKRKYVNLNLFSWLKRPHLGMLPIIQAGDKGFYDYGRKLSKELNINLVVHCTGHQLEQREFFLGFAGISQKLKNNQRMYSYNILTKFKMLYWYSLQFILNPSYINSALLDNFNGFLASFVRKDDFLHLFNYEPWNEREIQKVLNEKYNWQDDISYGKNQWRLGDGQTAFNNFVYYTIAGFSEFDNFRSNQIREGILNREEALELCQQDNKTKYDTLKNFSDVIGFNLDNVLSKINCLDKLY
jgi:glucosamine--fructose-6-phosphate aminotransferase (isomerizing)